MCVFRGSAGRSNGMRRDYAGPPTSGRRPSRLSLSGRHGREPLPNRHASSLCEREIRIHYFACACSLGQDDPDEHAAAPINCTGCSPSPSHSQAKTKAKMTSEEATIPTAVAARYLSASSEKQEWRERSDHDVPQQRQPERNHDGVEVAAERHRCAERSAAELPPVAEREPEQGRESPSSRRRRPGATFCPPAARRRESRRPASRPPEAPSRPRAGSAPRSRPVRRPRARRARSRSPPRAVPSPAP